MMSRPRSQPPPRADAGGALDPGQHVERPGAVSSSIATRTTDLPGIEAARRFPRLSLIPI
jgi:hypothetical protein